MAEPVHVGADVAFVVPQLNHNDGEYPLLACSHHNKENRVLIQSGHSHMQPERLHKPSLALAETLLQHIGVGVDSRATIHSGKRMESEYKSEGEVRDTW